MKLLVHICCANCVIYPLTVIKQKGINVIGFWFNPNIHPFTEYQNRLKSLEKFQSISNLKILYVNAYGLKEFIRNVVGKENNRCEYCYRVRLEKTAMTAKELKCDGFTTSLLVSPYQKFEMIVKIGKQLEKRHSIEFFMEDFRDGFYIARAKSKELGLYQQKYCGCIYSEMERYYKTYILQ